MRSTRTYLEQTAVTDIRDGRPPELPLRVVRAEEPSPEFARYLYAAVGADWQWTWRLSWNWQRWQDHLTQPGVENWVGWVRGTPAGYAELHGRPAPDDAGGAEVEIACFGLLPSFIGRRLGGHLLTEVLRRAWSLADRHPGLPPVRRVWLRTSTLDGPHALDNYLARGLRVVRTEEVDKPPVSLQPWPGADRPR